MISVKYTQLIATTHMCISCNIWIDMIYKYISIIIMFTCPKYPKVQNTFQTGQTFGHQESLRIQLKQLEQRRLITKLVALFHRYCRLDENYENMRAQKGNYPNQLTPAQSHHPGFYGLLQITCHTAVLHQWSSVEHSHAPTWATFASVRPCKASSSRLDASIGFAHETLPFPANFMLAIVFTHDSVNLYQKALCSRQWYRPQQGHIHNNSQWPLHTRIEGW